MSETEAEAAVVPEDESSSGSSDESDTDTELEDIERPQPKPEQNKHNVDRYDVELPRLKRGAEWMKSEEFRSLTSSSDEDDILEGEELKRELEKQAKMRSRALADMQRHCENSAFVNDYVEYFKTEMSEEEFKKSELEIYAACLPHPYPL